MIHIPKKVCTTGNSTIWNNRTLPGQMHLKGVQKILFTSNLYGKQNRKRLMQLTRYRKLSVSFFFQTQLSSNSVRQTIDNILTVTNT